MDEQTKEDLDQLQEKLARRYGQKVSHAAVLARMLRFVREREREFVGGEDWKPFTLAEKRALMQLPVKSGVRVSAKDIDKLLYGGERP